MIALTLHYIRKNGKDKCRKCPFPLQISTKFGAVFCAEYARSGGGRRNLDNVHSACYIPIIIMCISARGYARGETEDTMAEEKKKIMIHTASGDHVVDMSDKKPKPKFGVLPVSDYVAAVADPDAQPQAGSVGAVVAALAAAMGSLAVQALRSDDEALRQTAEELRQMTDYMVFQIDEELRAREPLDRRRVEENVTRTDLDSALRVASDIPNEIVYIMCRCIELMKEVVDKGDDLTACSALAAVHLSMAAIRCMQAELLSYAKEMDDDVFGYTIVREAELNLANHQELIDGLVEELTRRLTREKK